MLANERSRVFNTEILKKVNYNKLLNQFFSLYVVH
jgi:hypothetical protein